MRKIGIHWRIIVSVISIVLFGGSVAKADLTIEECVRKAENNYPLIARYDLLHALSEIDLSDVSKDWLPRVSVYGQATAQNVVPSYPEALTGMLQQMGQEVKGLGKIQYKLGVDVSQTVWDGGVARERRRLIQAQESIDKATLDIELYSVRQRVENYYFAILLAEGQLESNRIMLELLSANIEKINSMVRNGVAMQADADMMEARRLAVSQTNVSIRSSISGLRRMLGLFMGENVDSEVLSIPTPVLPCSDECLRPELQLIDKRLEVNNVSLSFSDTSLRPKIGFFAQAYYGYPGMDYFKSMMTRDLSFNLLAGVRLSWNIDSFYTRGNTRRKIGLRKSEIENTRDVFLFNTQLQTEGARETIEGLREIIADDARIVSLSASVRKAAESQLDNGIVDVTALLSKISDENEAKVASTLHEIQLAQEIYRLKYLLNR